MLAGITDPLNDLPDMHAVIDVVEALVIEGKANEGGDAVQRFFFDLYKPEAGEKPAGFDEDDQMAAFDAFAGGLGELR